MKVGLCFYSGHKIYPGHGKRFIRCDGKTFQYANGRCQRSADLKRNPREIRWTALYRRQHKKGQQEQEVKKRTKRTHKVQRAFAGATMLDIMTLRNQKPEMRTAMREQAIKHVKDVKRSRGTVPPRKKAAAADKATKTPKAATVKVHQEKAARPVMKQAPKNRTQR
ncbi:hypothetical protein ACOME3_002071 [Neoechinorhynchus agilis]